MKALLIGAGAVGQVYGRHLQIGGAEVGFFVKEKYAEECRAGMPLYPLNKGKNIAAETFNATIFTDLEEALKEGWDEVWLCVSSTALMGDWLETVSKHLGNARLIALQPGVAAIERIESLFAAEEVVWGGISLISYQTPIKGVEDRAQGIAYWFPPMGPSPFWGHEAGARQAVAGLKAGGCPAKFEPAGGARMVFGSALLMPHLVALESVGWSFAELRKGKWLSLAGNATKEAISLLSEHTGHEAPTLLNMMRPFWMGAITRVADCVVPLPLEPYLEYHFTKVGDQTRAHIGKYRSIASELGRTTPAIDALTSEAQNAGYQGI